MNKICIALVALAIFGTASAQMYKWVDKDGKVRYGDTPPPGAKSSQVKAPQSGAAAAPAPASKDGKKGPLTPAEQEQDYRKRQAESKKAAEKADSEQQAKAEKNEGCDRTREYLRTLESGQRIARTNPSGERYYMNEEQVAAEVAKTQKSVQQTCK